MTPTRSCDAVSYKSRTTRRRGLTIVEMLLVIAVIMLLLGILLPSLGVVQRRSRKLTEQNYIRQVGMAWSMYANQHNDAAIPGYLDYSGVQSKSVQQHWRVRYEYPSLPMANGQPITYDPRIPDDVSAPWTWRLAEYFSYNPEILWGYRQSAHNDIQSLVDNAQDVALTPAFGYNALYIGGWWRMAAMPSADPSGGDSSIRPTFAHWDATTLDGKPINVVVRTLSTINRPDNFIVFCSSSNFPQPGVYPRVDDQREGSFLVTPPTVAEDQKWRLPRLTSGASGETARADTSRDTIETIEPDVHAPIARHNGFVALLQGDGSTDTQTIRELVDQRRWINGLSDPKDRNFNHKGTYWPLTESD